MFSMWPSTENLGWGSSVQFSESTQRLQGPWKVYSFRSPVGALEQSNHYKSNHIHWLLPVSDWVDGLIGPTEFTISTLPTYFWSQFQFFVGGVGKKLVTTTWMWKIFLEGHIQHQWGDHALTKGDPKYRDMLNTPIKLSSTHCPGLFCLEHK
jgi:hypothetical protein